MSGYATYQWYQRVESQARDLGFRLDQPRHYYQETGDVVSLYPLDNALPIYSRDAEIYTGTFADVERFLTGWTRAQQYDAMLRMTDDKRRKKFENAERERQRVAKLKAEKREVFGVLANKTKKETERIAV